MSVITAHIDQPCPTPNQQTVIDMADAMQSLARDVTRETAADCIVKFDHPGGDYGTWRIAIEAPVERGDMWLADALIYLLATLKMKGVEPCQSSKELLATLGSF